LGSACLIPTKWRVSLIYATRYVCAGRLANHSGLCNKCFRFSVSLQLFISTQRAGRQSAREMLTTKSIPQCSFSS
jgi:hypothetical protein